MGATPRRVTRRVQLPSACALSATTASSLHLGQLSRTLSSSCLCLSFLVDIFMSKSKPSKPDQLRISSFFSQSSQAGPSSSASGPSTGRRPRSPIDLTDDDEAAMRPKKRKISANIDDSWPLSPVKHLSVSPNAPRNARGAEKYRFDPTSPTKNKDASSSQNLASSQRRERLRRILDDRNLFRRGSDEAEPGADTDHEENEHATDGERDVEEETGIQKHASFEDTMAFFANTKAKPKATQARKKAASTKKAQEIGPSGLPYTPLELQVRVKYPFMCTAPKRHLDSRTQEAISGYFIDVRSRIQVQILR